MADSIGRIVEDVTGLDVSNSSASDRALAAQQGAAHEANNVQRYMYDQTRADNEPWRQTGINALGNLANPEFQSDFSAEKFQTDPGYQFRMAEGQKAIERSAAARGGLNSGATAKALTRYSQGVASDEYQRAYDRFNNDRNTRFNRLASLAGIGQTATGQNQMANQNYAGAYGENVMGGANAEAAAAIGQAGQRSAFIGQLMQNAGAASGGGVKGGGAAFSDERVKTNVVPISKQDLQEMKSKLKAYFFNYTDDCYGKGDWVGVMAQDLEKSKLGKTLVFEDENGFKKIDIQKVMSLFLATLAEG